MKSLAAPRFWFLYDGLPAEIKKLADKTFGLWRSNPRHPSLQYKPIGDEFWTVRVGAHYRALGRFQDGETFVWLWIGTHERYNKL